MKISIDKNILISAIDVASKAVANKTTLPILEGILLEASGSRLRLTANNLEFAIQHTVDCEVLVPGAVVVEANLFSSIIRKMPDEEIDLIVDNGSMNIEAGKAVMQVKVQGASGFPAIPVFDADDGFEMDQAELRHIVSKVSFSASMDQTRPVLQGILFDIKGRELNAVTADGFMLSMVKNSIDTSDKRIIVNAKVMDTIAKILGEGSIKITMKKNQAFLEDDHTKISLRLIEGEFLAYQRLVQREYTAKAKIRKKDLQESLDRSLLVFETHGKNVDTLNLHFHDDEINIKMDTSKGSISESIYADISGEDLKIAFHPGKLSEILRRIDEKDVVMNLTHSKGPCIITPVEGDGFLYLVLPVIPKGGI